MIHSDIRILKYRKELSFNLNYFKLITSMPQSITSGASHHIILYKCVQFKRKEKLFVFWLLLKHYSFKQLFITQVLNYTRIGTNSALVIDIDRETSKIHKVNAIGSRKRNLLICFE